MKKFFAVVALAGLAAAANAQAPTATYTWQVSDDNGATWDAEATGNGATVKVRLLASWTGIADALGVGYGGGQFDATLLSAGLPGVVSNISRPVPFNFAAQTLVASAVVGGMKIDTAADVSAPGAGTGWVNPGQGAYFANPAGFNSINGAVVFQYDILTGINEVNIGMVLNTITGRAMSVYSNDTGTQVRISSTATTINGARIVVPTPGSLALLGLGGLAAARRRR
eukprot:TRINITY_DN20428_c0_g1_i1.p1 TRINITY_DN20428_c0_g1~~TRINITY_DN20428_c0_g1_i1.p1  ORF type:complete len:226 (+),score=50.28 TRINITY_DN20428_c0_g1_i1:63-740(+)